MSRLYDSGHGVLVPFLTRFATNAMVCAPDHLAAGVGVEILRRGGNAVDAAVAASAVLAVTSQHACGMGGDLFAVVSVPPGSIVALNASGRAGSGADPDRLRAEGHTSMPAAADIRSCTVPGCVDGWLALHERYGRITLAEVLEPARLYALGGFAASVTLSESYRSVAGLVEARDYHAAADMGGRLRPGSLVRRPGIAAVLGAIANGGREAFYQGEFGETLIEIGHGEFSKADLRRVQADWVDPISLEAWGHRVWTVPPNSQGYLTLAGAWIAQGLELPDDPDDPAWAHLLIEAARQAGQDRPEVLYEGADPSALLDLDMLARRRAAINPQRVATVRDACGEGGTIYLCAVDRDRMGVSLTQSNFIGWGNQVIVPGSRIFLHNRGAAFTLKPGHPAEYQPGRRPPHTLSPAAVTASDGSLHSVIGTMSGDSQPQVLLQLLARVLHARQSPADALAAPRWVLSGPPTRAGSSPDLSTGPWGGEAVDVQLEGHAPPDWDEDLRRRGHRVLRVEPFSHNAGHAHLITITDDHLCAAADPRTLGGDAAAW